MTGVFFGLLLLGLVLGVVFIILGGGDSDHTI